MECKGRGWGGGNASSTLTNSNIFLQGSEKKTSQRLDHFCLQWKTVDQARANDGQGGHNTGLVEPFSCNRVELGSIFIRMITIVLSSCSDIFCHTDDNDDIMENNITLNDF